MFYKIKQAIQNPKRIIYRYREKLTRKVNKESLLDDVIRHFPAKEKKIKIFFVAPKYDYGDINRGLGFEENNFLHALIHSGYEVLAFDPLFIMKRYDKKMMNRLLIESIYRWNPDIVFFILFKNEIEFDTLTEIKDIMGIKTVNWFCDDHWRFDNFSKYYAPYFSYSITTYKGAIEKYKKIGYKSVILSQWACNHFLYKKLNLPYNYDVSFVGQPHGDRSKIIKTLKKAGINVETFGFGWPKGRVSTYEMIKIFNQTKINLNLSNASRGRINQIKGRDFEIPGCGGFMITGNNEDLTDYFSVNEEVVTYSDVSDLIEKVKYYLEHNDEREIIRRKAYIRTLNEHTYTKRFSDVFKTILGETNE
ncbi:MAG TPA: hypothetical protein DHV62_03780 [Elusimicrobia bacterium]|nr:hypothetical protein [Elusimicrobiota bacterium]